MSDPTAVASKTSAEVTPNFVDLTRDSNTNLLLAMCDHSGMLLWLCAGAPGTAGDLRPHPKSNQSQAHVIGLVNEVLFRIKRATRAKTAFLG